MKNKLTLAALVAITGFAGSTNASIILTGIVDGPLSGGTPKAIELYVLADIADLSLYGIELVTNSGTTASTVETFFSGSANAGDFLYVATESSNFTSVFGFAPDFVTNDVNHNGDDDLYIYGPDGASTPGAILLDAWGASDGVDNSGTAADILDSWAYRNNGTGPGIVFSASDWTIAPTNSLDGLDAAGTAAAVPFGTYVVPEPSSYALLAGLSGIAMIALRRRRQV